jgi:hypothetical protein
MRQTHAHLKTSLESLKTQKKKKKSVGLILRDFAANYEQRLYMLYKALFGSNHEIVLLGPEVAPSEFF